MSALVQNDNGKDTMSTAGSLPPPRIRGNYGYSTQSWIAYVLNRDHLGGQYLVWFSREFNPLQNPDSANPLWIYFTVDRAVKLRDVGAPKIKELRATLDRLIQLRLGVRDSHKARQLRAEVARAPLNLFRPQVWRLDLTKIAPTLIESGDPSWDEQRILLRDGEFEVIIE